MILLNSHTNFKNGELENFIIEEARYWVYLILRDMSVKSMEVLEHSQRVSYLAFEMGKELGLSIKNIKELYTASMLHDLGKIFIPGNILNKPERVTKEEYKIIKTHSIKGFEIINSVDNLKPIANIVLYHHERYDGLGYPNGKKGEEIPLLSRIISVADSFDAMISPRIYKKQLTLKSAIGELEMGKSKQFDKDLVDTFIGMVT